MTPKNKLFIGILLFGLIVNILVIFNLNLFYLRAILAFIFIITVPGLLIMLCLKIRNINLWEYLVYTIGLSVAFIMFAGLAVNWILPWLHITDKPLSLYPILICFDTFLLALLFIAHKRNEDNAHILIFPFQEYEIKGKSSKRFKFLPKFPSLSWLDRIFIIIPLCFPFMAVIGAFLLNNHGTNIVTMLMLASIAVYVFCIVLFRDKLNENVFPWALWMIGLSLLLMYSLRGWYINGSDISEEYKIFQFTLGKDYWNPIFWNHGYYFMISLTILPTILTRIISIGPLNIVKIIFQIIFAILPLLIWILFKRYNQLLAFLSAFFFISQVQFFIYSGWIRQEIALLFFGLMLLVLFSKEVNPKLKKLLFVTFGFSMIVSHYSTAYISLALFLLTYICIFFYRLYEIRKIKKGKLKSEKKTIFYLSGISILLLLIFGFLWYSQVTITANGLIDFTKKSFSNLEKTFSDDNKQEGQSIFDQINIFYKRPDPSPLIKDYEKQIVEDYRSNSALELYNISSINTVKITGFKLPEALIAVPFSNNLYFYEELFKKIIRLFIIPGFIFLCYLLYKKEIEIEGGILLFSVSCVFILIIILPFSSLNYNMARLYQQSLILNSMISICGGIIIFSIISKRAKEIILTFFLLLFFLINCCFVPIIIGGQDITLHIANMGSSYEGSYARSSEVRSSLWLATEKDIKEKIYAEPLAEERIRAFTNMRQYTYKDVLESTLSRKSYVYLDYSNAVLGKGFLPSLNSILKRVTVFYSYPNEFLNDNKNKIYSNGESEIFK